MTEPLERAWMRHLETVRWFGGKGAGAAITQVEPLPAWTPPGAPVVVRSEIATLSYPDGRTEYYHLLVSHRPLGPDAEASGFVVGEAVVDGRAVAVLDATTDPEALSAFVRATQPAFADAEVGVWPGEQSNTTLTLGRTDLYKLFRRVEPGPNLDAEMLIALDAHAVPSVRGRLTGAWPGGSTTDLGLVIERVPGARDGWVLATASCAAESDFSSPAEALGRALADVHARLAGAFGVRTASGDDLADTMVARLDAAVAQAPELAGHAASLRAAFDVLRGQQVDVQRVHGDFHLGQTLSGDSGWTLIDFEGEPAKTAAERRAFDSVWRDVAGMLRSFDYARSAHADPAGRAATMWADAARAGFLKGYCGGHARDDLLAGYVIDKAVYEVLYELRNRPDWVGIPMRAIREASGRPKKPSKE